MRAAKHTPHDNGGAAGNWKVLSIHPPLRVAMAFSAMSFQIIARLSAANSRPFTTQNAFAISQAKEYNQTRKEGLL